MQERPKSATAESQRLRIFEGAHVGQASRLTPHNFHLEGLRLGAYASQAGRPRYLSLTRNQGLFFS